MESDGNQAGNDLAKVLHYYDLLEGSNEFKIVCPFHEDVNASMKINLGDGSYYCFGCGATGDALKFVMMVNKDMDQLRACKRYVRILRSKKVRSIKVEHRKKTQQVDKQALAEAWDYYNCLSKTKWHSEDGPEKAYMKKRGFSVKALRLSQAKINPNASYPLVFPMFDLDEFKGWVCRTMNKNIEKKRKYLYNEGFSRRNTLVGDYQAQTVMVVEGYMDRLKMLQFGAVKVFAILGWKATDEQIQKLKRAGVNHIISALDNDECGRKGTAYLKKHFEVSRINYPEGVKDPGDLKQEQYDKIKADALWEGSKWV